MREALGSLRSMLALLNFAIPVARFVEKYIKYVIPSGGI